MKQILIILVFMLSYSSTSISFAESIQLPNQYYIEHQSTAFSQDIVLHETSSSGYYQYINGRYAFSVFIPKNLSLAYLPSNDDGCRFSSIDGTVTLTASGGHIAYNSSNALDDYFALRIKAIGISNTEFIDHGDNWFVISWKKDGKIYYQKTFISNRYKCDNTIEISYPIDKKINYNEIVEIIERNFIPGWKTGYKIWG